jgi:hypothetical protein
MWLKSLKKTCKEGKEENCKYKRVIRRERIMIGYYKCNNKRPVREERK